MTVRTSREDYFLDIAHRCAQQGTCLRRNFGAVVVDSSDTIISTGYSGAPRGIGDCTLFDECWREKNNIPSGQNYERCYSVHAEQNALLQSGKKSRGGVMYISGFDVKTGNYVKALPCFLCIKMILNAEIKMLVIREDDGSFRRYSPISIFEKQSESLFK